MRYAGPTQKRNVALQKLGINARQESADARKGNRFGTSGDKSRRGIMEMLSEPDPKKRRAASRLMGKIRSDGKVGHHGFPVSKLGQGALEAYEKGGLPALRRFRDAYKDKGHNPKGLLSLTHEVHDKIHNVDEPRLHRSIKRAGQDSAKVFNKLKPFFNMLQKGPDGNPGTINPIKPKNQKTNKRNRLKMPKTRFNIDRSIGEDLLPTKDVFMDPGGYAPPIGKV